MDSTVTAPQNPVGARAAFRRFLRVVHPVEGPAIELETRLVVGRAPGKGQLTLDDVRASRAHFELTISDELSAVRLRDLGSKNGTLLNGQRIESEYLHGSAVIRAGDTLLVFSECAPPPDGARPAVPAGCSPALTYAHHVADRVAPLSLPVLVRGPTGAGKELIARRIHRASGRRGPLVSVNCATFGRELLASELFGHVPGAFTGARGRRDGLFVRAAGGTLFLDEIAEMPLEQQPALLRAVQEGRVRPVGSDAEVPVDVRVVAATHQDLEALVQAGRFREDLLARLAGVTVELPGLAERRAEVLPLFREFSGGLEPTIDAAEALLAYTWPRNVRELQHVAAAAAAFARGDRIDIGALPAAVQRAIRRAPEGETASLQREDWERLLREHGGNVSTVARHLGRSRQQVYRRLRALGIDPDRFRPDTRCPPS